MTADPKVGYTTTLPGSRTKPIQAMQHILHKSGYNYSKRSDVVQMAKMFGGPEGIVATGGEFSA